MAKFDFGTLGAVNTTNTDTTSNGENKKVRHLGEVALNDGPLVVRGLIKALGDGPLTLAGFTAKKDFEKVGLVLATALLQGGNMTADKIRAIEVLSRSKGEDRGRKRKEDDSYDTFRDLDPDNGGDGFNVRLLRWMLESIGEIPVLDGETPPEPEPEPEADTEPEPEPEKPPKAGSKKAGSKKAGSGKK